MKSTRLRFNPFHTRKSVLLPALALLSATGTSLQAQTWGGSGALSGTTTDASHSWSTAGNWSPSGAPNATGATANISADFSAVTSIFLNGPITVGSLTLNDAGASGDVVITIAGGTGTPSLTFDNTSGNAVLATAGAANVISAPMTFTDSVDLTTTNGLTLSGVISGAGTLNKLNAGTSSVTLSGANTAWSGGIKHERGTINISGSSGSILGTGDFTFANLLTGGGANTLSFNAANSRLITNKFVNNNAGGAGSAAVIEFQGGGSGFRIQTLSGGFSTGGSFNNANILQFGATYTDAAANEGTIVVSGNWSSYAATAVNASAVKLSKGGTLLIDSANSMAGGSASGTYGGYEISNPSTLVTGKIILNGAYTMNNTLTFSNTAGLRNSFGSRNAAATTATIAGAVNLGAATVLGGNLFSQTAGATLNVSGLVSGASTSGLEINKSYTFTSADLTNTTQTPTGIVELSRAAGNTYTGGTTVTAGSLLANNTSGSATGTGNVTVSSAATLGGTGIISGGVNVTGVLSPGASIGSLATGAVAFLSGSKLTYELQDTGASGADLMDVTGNLSLAGIVTLDLSKIGVSTWNTGDKLTLISYTGILTDNSLFSYAGGDLNSDGKLQDDETFTFDGSQWVFNYNDTLKGANYNSEATGTFVTMTVIPEPNAAAVLGTLGVLVLLRRRRKA